MWGQFLPASLLLLISWEFAWALARMTYGGSRLEWETWRFLYPVVIASTLLCLPFIGLSFSLALKNQVMAGIATCVAGLLVPLGLAGISYSKSDLFSVGGERGAMYVIVLEQFLLALLAWLFLRLNFTRRTFALDERRR